MVGANNSEDVTSIDLCVCAMSTSDDFPLDISYSEISQWLSSRRKLSSDWIKRLRDVQSQAQKAFKNLPTGFSSQFEPGEDGTVEYSVAKSIRDKLAENTERGYFGGLSGEAGVWDRIVRSYEKGNLYLGEAGQRIVKNVDYEVPFMKKHMETLDKRVLELSRRKSDCENSAATAASNFGKDCKQLGIGGVNLKSDIDALSDKIYEILQAAFDELRKDKIRSAVEFYRAMSSQLHEMGGDALSVVQSVFDDSVQAPTPELIRDVHPHLKDSQHIPAGEEDIDKSMPEADFEINWDVGGDEDPDAEVSEMEIEMEWEQDGGISWEIEMESNEAADPASSPVIEKETSSQTVAEIQPTDAEERHVQDVSPCVLCFVWDGSFRNALLDDLYELQSFLMVRAAADASDAVSLTFAEVSHKFDQQELATFLSDLSAILGSFTGDMAQQYLMLKTSENYSDRLLAEFQKKAHREEEWKTLGMKADQERKSVQTELSQVAIKLGHLARQTKDLKLLVEQGISPLFNNRQINVMGKINAVISTC